MKRREFLATTVSAGAIAAAGGAALGSTAPDPKPRVKSKGRFKLKYAPHFGMFKHHGGDDLIDQLKFMADEGFEALEDNGMGGKSVEQQKAIAAEMERLDMHMGVFVANFGTAFGKRSFVNGDQAMVDAFIEDLRKSVEVAKRVNATWMTVVMGDFNPRLEWDYQTANAIEMLKRGAEVFEPHGLVMVLEPLNPWAGLEEHIEIVHGDATATGLPEGRSDFVWRTPGVTYPTRRRSQARRSAS